MESILLSMVVLNKVFIHFICTSVFSIAFWRPKIAMELSPISLFFSLFQASKEVFKVLISCLLLFVSFLKVSMVLSLLWIPFFISWVW